MQDLSRSRTEKRLATKPARAIDKRTLQTREKLSWSFIELAQQQGFDATTVQDVIERAKVGRSTFYAHFADKDDMFIQHFIGFVESLAVKLEHAADTGRFRLPVGGFFEHVGQMQPLYLAMVTSHRLDPMLKIGRVVLAAALEKRMRVVSVSTTLSGVPLSLVANHMAATLVNCLTWWMDHHQPCTAQELDRYYNELICVGQR